MSNKTVERNPQKTEFFDPKKVNALYEKVVGLFAGEQLTAEEIIVTYGNLGFVLGASIQGILPKDSPSPANLEKMYRTNPTIGVALMCQAMEVTGWYTQLQEIRANSGEKEADKP